MTHPAQDHSGVAADITVLLDGQPRRLPAATTLAALIEQLGHAPERVGTAVNGDFVARSQRAARVLTEGEQVLLFQPIVGG
ncbi:MAG: sulfur carrier protein ThiS [Burkholderiaceae bacterium]|nr:sulfur carrier protein ThiS [Burkholderiaceae bacterium]